MRLPGELPLASLPGEHSELESSDGSLRLGFFGSRGTVGTKAALAADMRRGSALDDRWLDEACAAFGVSKYGAGYGAEASRAKNTVKQENVVDAVVRAVSVAKQALLGDAAATDAERRAARLSRWRTQHDVTSAAKELGVHGGFAKGEWAAFKRRVLVAACPEDLRLAVVKELVERECRLPDPATEAESFAHAYLHSALSRRHVGDSSGEPLTSEQVGQWDAVLGLLPAATRPEWQEDPVLVLALAFYREHGSIDVPKPSPDAEPDDAKLAEGLRVLRRARNGDCRDRAHRLLRRQLTSQDILRWEAELPREALWGQRRAREEYVPGESVLGSRHEWSRTPFLCKPCACYLCGQDFEKKSELVSHWREAHLDMKQEEKDALSAQRVEEEIRKRLFWDEAMGGPFEVRGQEQRRIIGRHAQHQTHSVPGAGCFSDEGSRCPPCGRHLGGCVVCARSMWAEELYDMDLFAKPSDPAEADGDDEGEDEAPEEAESAEESTTRWAVDPACASKVNQLLSVREYARRWPRIPKHELWASSVAHPHKPEWRWSRESTGSSCS